MARTPLHPDTNGDNPAHRLGRPSRSIPAYRDLSDEALEVAREWWDQSQEDQKAAAERKARMEEWDKSPEGQAAREQMRKNIAW